MVRGDVVVADPDRVETHVARDLHPLEQVTHALLRVRVLRVRGGEREAETDSRSGHGSFSFQCGLCCRGSTTLLRDRQSEGLREEKRGVMCGDFSGVQPGSAGVSTAFPKKI